MKAARHYAQALVDVVLEQGNADKVKAELRAFLGLVEESADLRNFLASPAVGRPAKQAVIEKLVARLGASTALRNFLFVIVDNRRASILPQIQQEFESQLYARLGIAQAQVVSARELSGAERTTLVGALERITGKKVEASYGLDPALIGGAVVRVGSTIYNGSVRDQLDRLRAKLANE